MNQPSGIKKDLISSVFIAAATAFAVRVAEMAFDKVRERMESKQESYIVVGSKSKKKKKR